MNVNENHFMITRKRLVISIGAWMFILLIFVITQFFIPKKQPVSPAVFPTPMYPQPTPTRTIIIDIKPSLIPDRDVSTTPPTPVVKADSIIVNGIPVDDFYKTASKVTEEGDVLLVETVNYQISYLKQFQEFKITIITAGFDQARKEAEARFLTLLGIDKNNACRLSVEVSSPQYANNKYAGMVFPLSFCADNEF